MKFTLLPLQNDALFRVRCDGPITLRFHGNRPEPLHELLGPVCTSHKILLNLQGAESIDTTGIAWLSRNHRAFQQAGGMLVLYNVPPVVLDLLDFMRLTELLHIAPDETAASALAAGNLDAGHGDSRPSVLRMQAAS